MYDSESGKQHISDAHLAIPSATVATQNSACDIGRQIPRRPHVYVCDDNTVCQKVLCRTLHKLDCMTQVGGTGKDACRDIADGFFDLILMDLRMPIMSGLEATQFLTQQKKVTTPIIGFSADSTQEIQEECVRCGMVGFIAKPASQLQIRECLNTYVRFKYYYCHQFLCTI